jgi:hypothetical protein
MKYVTTKEMHMRMGFSAFTLPVGSTVEINQVDTEHRKVLVEVGRDIDWVSDRIIQSLELVKEKQND